MHFGIILDFGRKSDEKKVAKLLQLKVYDD